MDTVSFKVVLKDPKASDEAPEVRRFNVDKEVSTSLDYIQERLVTLFPRLRREDFVLAWTDGDGDEVIVGSDEELIIALTEMSGPVYKLAVKVRGAKKAASDPEGQANARGAPHVGVICDGCGKDIYGFRLVK